MSGHPIVCDAMTVGGVLMLKRIGIIRRPEGMTAEALREHWLHSHAPIALRIPGLRSYRLNFVEKWDGENTQDWDGFAELWFDDEESMRRGFDAMKDEIARDREKFIGDITIGIVSEHVLMELDQGPPSAEH